MENICNRSHLRTRDMTRGDQKLIFWRRITCVLTDLKIANKDMFDHNFGVIKPDNNNDETQSEICPSRQVHASSGSGGETRTRGCEGLRIYAGVVTSARDVSVREVISDHPP